MSQHAMLPEAVAEAVAESLACDGEARCVVRVYNTERTDWTYHVVTKRDEIPDGSDVAVIRASSLKGFESL